MKKVISLSLLVIIMIIICLFCLSPITKNSMTHVAKEDTLYSKALDYVISKQKNASYHKDKEDYHIFTDYIPYGIEETGHYQHIFMWIHLESFYVLNDELIQDESFSIPYKITYKDNQVIQCETPESGDLYIDSIQRLFPPQIQNHILNHSSHSFDLSQQIQEYYAYLPSPDIAHTVCY